MPYHVEGIYQYIRYKGTHTRKKGKWDLAVYRLFTSLSQKFPLNPLPIMSLLLERMRFCYMVYYK
jgi:hypothetical protein